MTIHRFINPDVIFEYNDVHCILTKIPIGKGKTEAWIMPRHVWEWLSRVIAASARESNDLPPLFNPPVWMMLGFPSENEFYKAVWRERAALTSPMLSTNINANRIREVQSQLAKMSRDIGAMQVRLDNMMRETL